MYTIDANIFVREVNERDPEYSVCHELLEQLESNNQPIIVPLIIIPEVASAITRTYRDAMRGRLYSGMMSEFTNITFVSVDLLLAHSAAEIAADYGLRGMDAIYVAVARQYGCTFVTLDDEPYRRAAAIVPTRKPAEALAELPPE